MGDGFRQGLEIELYTHFPDPESSMLTMLAVILIVLWALGLVGGYVAGGLLHILLVMAVVVLLVGVFAGRRIV